MKKLLTLGLAIALIAGTSTFTKAVPVSDMDIDISGLAQFNYNWSERTSSDDELDTTRLRLQFAAMPAENVSVYAAIEGTDNMSGTAAGAAGLTRSALATDGGADSRVVDLYVDLTYLDWMTARIGQFPLPISYDLNTPEYELETINYSIGVGMFGVRDRGIMLMGDPIPELGWAIWGMNGNGAATGAGNDTDDQTTFGLQLDWNALENLSFKLYGSWQKDGLANETTLAMTPDTNAFGIGVNYAYRGFHLFGEYNDANQESLFTNVTVNDSASDTDTKEWFIHGSYKIPQTDLQLVVRHNRIDQDTTASTIATGALLATTNNDDHCTTVGLNWDFEKNARLQIMREFWDGTNTDDLDIQLSVRF